MNKTPSIVYNFSPAKRVVLFSIICLGFLAMGFFGGIVVSDKAEERLNQPLRVETLSLAPPPADYDIIEPMIDDPETQVEPVEEFEWAFTNLEEEVDCLAKNIYFESRNEDVMGQIAVGLATINRVKSHKFPDTVCEVVWEKRRHPETGRWVAQFSWTWDGKKDTPLEQHHWEESIRLAQAMLAEGILDNFVDITNGADHYHATYVNPWWSKHMRPVFLVGLHKFYIQKAPVVYRN